jgi:hypothetical protein
MKSLKKTSMGALAMLLIVLLAGLPAGAATEGSQKEINISMIGIGEGGFLGRIGLGFFNKGVGFECGAETAPWSGLAFGIFDGALVLNPFLEKSISPVLRIGALTTIIGGFLPEIGVGLRLRLNSKSGFRVEYNHFPGTDIGLVVVGVFGNF